MQSKCEVEVKEYMAFRFLHGCVISSPEWLLQRTIELQLFLGSADLMGFFPPFFIQSQIGWTALVNMRL